MARAAGLLATGPCRLPRVILLWSFAPARVLGFRPKQALTQIAYSGLQRFHAGPQGGLRFRGTLIPARLFHLERTLPVRQARYRLLMSRAPISRVPFERDVFLLGECDEALRKWRARRRFRRGDPFFFVCGAKEVVIRHTLPQTLRLCPVLFAEGLAMRGRSYRTLFIQT